MKTEIRKPPHDYGVEKMYDNLSQEIEQLLVSGEAKLVPWDDRYAVTKCGRVFSRCVRSTRYREYSKEWKLLRGGLSSGYIRVAVGTARATMVHRLVAEVFIGKKPNGLETRHLDGNRKNNNVLNLAYGTRQENIDDKVRHGMSAKGERNPSSKLTAAQVKEIRECYSKGMSYTDVATKFGLSWQAAKAIHSGKTWGWMDFKPMPKPPRGTGGRSNGAKLNEWDVRIVRNMKASGYNQTKIAKKMKCSITAISDICLGYSWSWLDKETAQKS